MFIWCLKWAIKWARRRIRRGIIWGAGDSSKRVHSKRRAPSLKIRRRNSLRKLIGNCKALKSSKKRSSKSRLLFRSITEPSKSAKTNSKSTGLINNKEQTRTNSKAMYKAMYKAIRKAIMKLEINWMNWKANQQKKARGCTRWVLWTLHPNRWKRWVRNEWGLSDRLLSKN